MKTPVPTKKGKAKNKSLVWKIVRYILIILLCLFILAILVLALLMPNINLKHR